MNWRSRVAVAVTLASCVLLPACSKRPETVTEKSSDTSTTVTTSSVQSANPGAGISSTGGTSQPSVSPSTAPSANNAPMMEDLSSLKIPLYPNVFERAFTDGGAVAALAFTGAKPDPNRKRVAQMTSHDSFDTVYAWYHAHMPHGSESDEAAASNHTNGDGERGAQFEIGTPTDPGYQHVLIIGKAGDDTTISLFGKAST